MAVLGLLKEQEMHGYELKKRLTDVFGLSTAVSFGSLYPALARLEVAGAVHVVVPSALAGARSLPVEGRLGLLEPRRAVVGERLAQLAARARARRDDRYVRVLSEREQ